MNKGVMILLERMDSNPEEFLPTEPYGTPPIKWRKILDALQTRANQTNLNPSGVGSIYVDLPFLNDEDISALYIKFNTIRGDSFTKEVMATLLSDGHDSSDQRKSGFGWNDPRSQLGVGSTYPNHPQMNAQSQASGTGAGLTLTAATKGAGFSYGNLASTISAVTTATLTAATKCK